MTNVTTFEPRQARRLTPSGQPVSAEILLFTGVRYVREDEPVRELGEAELPREPDGGGRDRSRRRRA